MMVPKLGIQVYQIAVYISVFIFHIFSQRQFVIKTHLEHYFKLKTIRIFTFGAQLAFLFDAKNIVIQRQQTRW